MLTAMLLPTLMACLATLMTIGRKGAIPASVFTFVATFLFFLIGMAAFGLRPTLALDGGSIWFWILVALGFGAFMAPPSSTDAPVRLLIPVAVFVGIIVAYVVTTSAMFHSSSYASLIEIEEVSYDHATPILPQEQIQVVDETRAILRASELIGAQKGLGSMYRFGDFRLVLVQGHPTWIAPLKNSRFVAGLAGYEVPGFVTVSAWDERDARLITDSPIRIHGPDDSFLSNVERHLWFGGYATTFLTNYVFEIDEDMRPHWVASKYRKAIGFDGLEVTGVVVVDARTGEISDYGIDDAPAWIDRIQPSDIAIDNLSYAGAYVHGWWNATFSGVDVIHPIGINTIVQRLDGRIAYYTGMETQTSQNGGTSGFALVDTRRSKATVYTTPGISEDTARVAMQGLYQDQGYKATFPRLYLVGGRPTFVSLMVDDGGNVKGYGMVAQETRNVFGKGINIDEARRDYVSRFSAFTGGDLAETASQDATFTVDRIGFNVSGGNTVALVVPPQGQGGQVDYFSVPAARFQEILVTEKGDRVTIGYVATPNGEAVVTGFRNDRFPRAVRTDQPAEAPPAN